MKQQAMNHSPQLLYWKRHTRMVGYHHLVKLNWHKRPIGHITKGESKK